MTNYQMVPLIKSIELCVREGIGGVWIVGRWNSWFNKWAYPAKFAGLGTYPTREEAQVALDEYAKAKGLLVWNGEPTQ